VAAALAHVLFAGWKAGIAVFLLDLRTYHRQPLQIKALQATMCFSRPNGRVQTALFFWAFAFGARSLWGLSGFLFFQELTEPRGATASR
jgi:hypothetical protein